MQHRTDMNDFPIATRRIPVGSLPAVDYRHCSKARVDYFQAEALSHEIEEKLGSFKGHGH